ncbi:unnamed protein product [Arabidopsis halleri]
MYLLVGLCLTVISHNVMHPFILFENPKHFEPPYISLFYQAHSVFDILFVRIHATANEC